MSARPTVQKIIKMEWEHVPGRGVWNGRYKPIKLEKRPYRVWTFLLLPGEEPEPTLPIVPLHNKNVFAEDDVHDWNWERGAFTYYTRVCAERDVWVLLEFD